MVIYLDLIFLANMIIDAAILIATAWTRKMRVQWWRIMIASIIGASYVLMMFFPSLSFLFTFTIKSLFALLMIYTAFGFTSLQAFAANVGTFYLINFVAAGGILAIHYFMMSTSEVWSGILFSRSGGVSFKLQVSTIFTIMMFAVIMLFYKAMMTSKQRREQLIHGLAEVTVTIDNEKIQCTGLIDTGNHLYDPLTRTPVMVLEYGLCQHRFPDGWGQRLKRLGTEAIMTALSEDAPLAWRDRLRMVPFKGINRNMQFMIAVKPDEVVIRQGSLVTTTKKVLVGLEAGELSRDGVYQAIIHPAMLN